MNKKFVISLAGAAGLALIVSGCGGGDNVIAPPAAQPATIAMALAHIVEQKSLPSTDIDLKTLQQTLPVADDTIEPGPV